MHIECIYTMYLNDLFEGECTHASPVCSHDFNYFSMLMLHVGYTHWGKHEYSQGCSI